MVTIRKWFSPSRDTETPVQYAPNLGNHSSAMVGHSVPPSPSGGFPPRDSSLSPPPLKANHPLNVEQHFDQIEKQFQDLHDHMQTQPPSSASYPRPPPSRASSRMTDRGPRHVDLVEALYTSPRNHKHSAATLSPITPYNEDIAERNMTRFMQTKTPRKKKGMYTRIVSALYQEDVADRNMAKNKLSSRSKPRNMTARPPQISAGPIPRARASDQKSSESERSDVGRKSGSRPRSSSQEALRSRSRSQAGLHTDATLETQPKSQALRPQKSAPSLSQDAVASQKKDSPGPVGHLGVPPAHKQGDTWSSAPLPESPTLPVPMRLNRSVNENIPTPKSPLAQHPLQAPPTVTPRSSSRTTSPVPPSRKNVRDLSINTELAALGTSQSKISHRAIQPPTPSNGSVQQNPSIAEVIGSPLPTATPTSATPSPLPATNQKLAEIMDMFKQAYTATPAAISPHPTFETLQDAIVREINSHEAFRTVPVPNHGPPFTPSPTVGSFDWSPNQSVSRTSSPGQFSKIIGKGTFKRHKRDSSMHKSISTSVPSKGYEKIFKRSLTPTGRGRRRHTDAPPPSPGFFETIEPTEPTQAAAEGPDEMTYMDVLLRSTQQKSHTPKKGSDFGVPKNLGHSHSLGTLSSHGFSEGSSAAPSVYYMRAQTSASSSDGRLSFPADYSDDEDDVIHLPSIGIPRVQIQGVDENNVQYMAGNTSPTSAYRLMNWPQKSRSIQQSFAKPGPQHIRGVRSVESY